MPKVLKFSGFNGGHPGVVLGKFGEDQNKTLLMGLFFSSKFPGWGLNSMPKVNHSTYYKQ